VNAVTGAFSYTGSYIARRLLEDGERVKTLSREPDPAHPLSDRVAWEPLAFERASLARALQGVTTLYNTYWIRFPRAGVTWETVLENTRVLLRSAEDAGVERIVHISVSNAAEESPLPYFRFKAMVEREVRSCGLSHAIVRPTLIFGREDILLHNIAWALRRFPIFLVPGDAGYRVQPVAAEDVAALAIELSRRGEEVTLDAAGPSVYSFEELVRVMRAAIGARTRIARVPGALALSVARLVGRTRGDVMITREELQGLAADLLVSRQAPLGRTRLEDWLVEQGDALGAGYVSELRRNWRAAT